MREHAALHEHGERVGGGKDRIHIVLDQNNRVIACEIAQERDDALRLFEPHAGERLVEEKQVGAARDQHRDFELALLAARELSRNRIAAMRETGDVERMCDALSICALHAPPPQARNYPAR